MQARNFIGARKTDRTPAVVLGTSTIGIAVIRSLGRMDVPVVGVDFAGLTPGKFSRYCRVVKSPDPEADEGGYVRTLLELGEQLGSRPVLFTTRDREVSVVARHRKELEQCYRIPMADSDLVAKLNDKRAFYELIRGLDVDYPATYAPKSAVEVSRISREIEYPYIVKPVDTVPFSRQFSVKCFLASNAEELIRGYGRAVKDGHEVILQEVIPGDETCLYQLEGYFGMNSEPMGLFMQRKIRNCPELYGIGSLAESCYDPGLERLGTRFMKRIGYRGIGEVEVKKDPRDGRFKILEVNARPWTQVGLATGCGINLPYMAYRDMIGEPLQKATTFPAGVKWLCMSDDFRTSLSRMLQGTLKPGQYVKSLRGKTVYSVLDRADPAPFLVSPFLLGNMSLNYLRKRARRKASGNSGAAQA